MTVLHKNRSKLIGQAKSGSFKPGGLGGKFRSKLKGYGSKTTGSKRKNVTGYGKTNKKKKATKDKSAFGGATVTFPKTPRATPTPGKFKGSKVMYGYKKGGQV